MFDQLHYMIDLQVFLFALCTDTFTFKQATKFIIEWRVAFTGSHKVEHFVKVVKNIGR